MTNREKEIEARLEKAKNATPYDLHRDGVERLMRGEPTAWYVDFLTKEEADVATHALADERHLLDRVRELENANAKLKRQLANREERDAGTLKQILELRREAWGDKMEVKETI